MAPAGVMAELDDFRAETERLLALADDQLALQERARLRAAIEERQGDWFALVGGTSVQGFAERLAGLLAEADRELPPDQVRELEALIRKRFPKYP